MHLLGRASSGFFSLRDSPDDVGVAAENIATGRRSSRVSAESCAAVLTLLSFVPPSFVRVSSPHLEQQRTPQRCLLW